MRTVEVIAYRASWIAEYCAEAELIGTAIGFLEPSIYHIGSTSVPGLPAKPVIDILVAVEDANHLDDYSANLARIEYRGLGENGIPGRRYFEKGGADRTHQIHGFTRDTPGVIRHLAFRDYLASHPNVAEAYASLKFQVARSCGNDIDRYCDGKDAFIKHHEKLALKWYSNNRSSDC